MSAFVSYNSFMNPTTCFRARKGKYRYSSGQERPMRSGDGRVLGSKIGFFLFAFAFYTHCRIEGDAYRPTASHHKTHMQPDGSGGIHVIRELATSYYGGDT